jgi:hypothetical protein
MNPNAFGPFLGDSLTEDRFRDEGWRYQRFKRKSTLHHEVRGGIIGLVGDARFH